MPAGVIFFTGDQVLLSDLLLLELRDAFKKTPDRIIVPVYDGSPGSPVTLPADMLPLLMELKGEDGGMKAVRGQEHRILRIPAEPGWQGLDLDTEETWEQVLRHMRECTSGT
jgi:molybdenum cofactor cytidylyltransferase